jgi:hypothetical protein
MGVIGGRRLALQCLLGVGLLRLRRCVSVLHPQADDAESTCKMLEPFSSLEQCTVPYNVLFGCMHGTAHWSKQVKSFIPRLQQQSVMNLLNLAISSTRFDDRDLHLYIEVG